jgi:hypothetical protein
MAGIYLESRNETSGFRNVRITNVVAHDNGHAGIMTFARGPLTYAVSDIYVAHSVAHNNHGYPESPVSGCGIWLSGVKGGMVEYCTAHDNGGRNGNQPGGGPVGIFAFWSNNITFQYNESYDNKTGNYADGGGFDFDWWTFNSTMQYNYSHDNEGAGFLICGCVSGSKLNNVTVRYNISENDGRRNFYPGIYITGGSHQEFRDVKVYNNTVYKSGGAPVVRVNGGGLPYEKISLRNNILIAADSSALVVVNDPQNATELFFQGNNYWSTSGNYSIRWGSDNYRTVQNWSNFTGQEKLNGSAVWKSFNPLLANAGSGGTMYPDSITNLTAYRLQSSSPMIAGPATGINAGHEELPLEYILEQNYPNPFNPSTKIEFSIPSVGTLHPDPDVSGGQVVTSLRVFDVLGREVSTLANESKPSGRYTVTWNAQGLPSGVYFVRLTAGRFMQTRKAVLMK